VEGEEKRGLPKAKEKGIERGEEREDDIKECAETQSPCTHFFGEEGGGKRTGGARVGGREELLVLHLGLFRPLMKSSPHHLDDDQSLDCDITPRTWCTAPSTCDALQPSSHDQAVFDRFCLISTPSLRIENVYDPRRRLSMTYCWCGFASH